MSEIDKRKAIGSGSYAVQGGGAAAIGTVVAARYAAALPDVGAAEIAAVAAGVAWIINLCVKMIRDRVYAKSALPVALVLVVLMLGCGSSGITLYRMVDGEPQPVVEIEQTFSGKGCIAVDSQGETASVIVQQAGTSDWGIPRMFSWIADIAGGVFGGTKSMDEPQGPATGMQGCEGLFVGGDDDEQDDPETLYRLEAVPGG